MTDIAMPETEGLEVLRKLRTAQPPVPVIAISGGGLGSGADYLAMATALRAAKVLLKPFPPAVLIAAITELLRDGDLRLAGISETMDTMQVVGK